MTELTLYGTLDTYLDEANPTSARAALSYLMIGFNGSSQEFVGLVKFDLSDVPRGVDFLSATLSLYQTGRYNTGLATVAHRLLRSWTSAATWRTYDGVNNWGTYGAASVGVDVAAASSGSFITGSTNEVYYDMDLDLDEFYNLLELNYGWRLNNWDNPPAIEQSSYESEDAGGSHPPKLTLVYNDASLGVIVA